MGSSFLLKVFGLDCCMELFTLRSTLTKSGIRAYGPPIFCTSVDQIDKPGLLRGPGDK